MADRDMKALTDAIETPVFDTTAFTTPPPLAEATVAIVTTASLHHPDQDDFAGADTGYRFHGTVEPWSIGTDSSSGCIRMFNEHVIDLYQRCPIGTAVQVLQHIADRMPPEESNG